MTTQMHLATQYLAAAGICFVDKKEDDSHTNLGFSVEKGTLYSRALDKKGTVLSLSYDTFSLEWNDSSSSSVLQLDGTTHAAVVEWINKMAANSHIATPYSYDLHYELPYQMKEDDVFKLEDLAALQKLKENRSLAQTVLEEFLDSNKLHSEIRIWPHHFDTGAFAPLKDSPDVSVGLGLAIPDSLSDQYYFYISGYKNGSPIAVTDLSELSLGAWKSEGFVGAVLPISGVNKDKGIHFFEEVINKLMTK